MFIYHYFITIPFVMLTIPNIICKLSKIKKQFNLLIPILSMIFLIFFIYFYPVYSGLPVKKERIVKTEWFKTWEYDGLMKEEREQIRSSI